MSLKDTLRQKLTPELFTQVTDALGDDFNFDVVPRSRLNKVIGQRDTLKEQLETALKGTQTKGGSEDDDDDDINDDNDDDIDDDYDTCPNCGKKCDKCTCDDDDDEDDDVKESEDEIAYVIYDKDGDIVFVSPDKQEAQDKIKEYSKANKFAKFRIKEEPLSDYEK